MRSPEAQAADEAIDRLLAHRRAMEARGNIQVSDLDELTCLAVESGLAIGRSEVNDAEHIAAALLRNLGRGR